MLLGIDVGTTHTKVGVYAPDGALLAHAEAPTPREVSGGAEHFPPEALWENAAALIRGVVSEVGIVKALAVASMGESGVTLDAEGKPTYPVIPWNDSRAAGQMEGLGLPPEKWFDITGLHPNPIHSVAKWLWLREHAPEAWEKTRGWLSVTGWVRFKLTGEAVMEATQAARTMAYDVRRGAWSGEVLGLARIPQSFLPPVVPGTARVGGVTSKAAALTGLKPGTPVFAGGHDHILAALACGAFSPEVALDSHGTAEALTLGLPTRPDPKSAGGFGVGPHVIEGHTYLLGGIYSAGGALEWVRKLLKAESFDALRALAASVEPGESPLFIAHFHGAAPPFNAPHASGAFVGLTPEHGPAHVARAVYEGIAFELRAGIEDLERVTGKPVQTVRMVGGSASDPLWSPLRAAVLGRPLECARHPDMVTAGAALLAGLGAGVYDSPQEAVARTYASSQTFFPDARTQTLYDAPYERYLRAARALDFLDFQES